MDKMWYCLVQDTTGCRVAHGSLESAKQEAERLARLPGNQGRLVFVLEMAIACRLPEAPVEWLMVDVPL